MSQKMMIGIALLVLGGVFLFLGINAANAPAEEFAEALTGQYSDRTVMYLVGGGIAAVIGLVMLVKK